MKNKTTKIIACVIAGLTLSACVGAVTVPTDTEKTTERETREIDPVPSAPQIDVGRGYYIGTLTSQFGAFRTVNGFRIDVDFDNRTLNGGESAHRSATSRSVSRLSRVDCAIKANDGITYQGDGFNCITPGRSAATYNLAVDGTFTPRGVISGTVSHETCAPTCERFPRRANLTGTVSKQRIVGKFSGDFSGGFTVNRR